MARPPRIEFSGALYHVSARGRDGSRVFLEPEDARRFIDFLGQVCGRFDWAVYAYCLLPGQAQLVIETRRPTLTEGMRRLSGRYVQAFNRRHGRRGPLFQGRFKAVLVDREPYLRQVCCAVLNAPVVAGLADQARAWRWSSCGAVLRRRTPDWLARDALLALFGAEPEAARAALADGLGGPAAAGDPWRARQAQIFLGSAGFIEAALAEGAKSRAEAPPRQPIAWFAGHYRDRYEAMARAHLEGGYGQPDVARHFGVHYSTVSRAADRWTRLDAAA
jgi:REP element-mobilizing transposase RayT